jgi:SAM-dependent methyltransferase
VASHVFSPGALLGIAPRRQMTGLRRIDSGITARIDAYLIAARRAGRRAILIVDNKCGDGRLLIRAAKRASALGFVAVDARGFDRSPERVRQALSAARFCRDPNIRLDFVAREGSAPLPLDDEADLMLADSDEDPPSVLQELTSPRGTLIDRGEGR